MLTSLYSHLAALRTKQLVSYVTFMMSVNIIHWCDSMVWQELVSCSRVPRKPKGPSMTGLLLMPEGRFS